MQILKAIVDTQRTNTTIGYVNTGDVVKLNLQVISNGEIGDNWVNPVIELHGIKSDKKRVRQTDNIQIVDLANHHLEITLHEQFMTCDGLVRLQLVIKDDGGRISSRRISSSVFYLRVTKSLEMGVMESHDYIQVFDDFDTYMELVKEFEAKMKEDVALLEAEIQKASDLSQSISKNEAERQEAFEMNESNREVQFNASQSSQTSTFTTNEAERQEAFEMNESNREVQFNQTQQTREDRFNQDQNTRETQFNASQSSQTSTFTTNEAERQKGETQRVANENARQTAERNREVRMAELETKTSELIEKADEQVLKVDEFINANTKQLLEEDARKDYMGNECRSIRETMNSNVDYAVKTAIGEFNYLDYEGQHITANNSIEGHVKSAILKGTTLVNLVKTTEYGGIQMGTCVDGGHPYKIIESVSGVGASILTKFQTIYPLSPSTVYYLKLTDVAHTKVFLVREHDNKKNLHTEIHDLENKIIKFTTSELGTSDLFLYQQHLQVGAKVKYSENFIISDDVDSLYNANDYFTGMQSVKMPVLTTTGKNLMPVNHASLDEIKSNAGGHINNFIAKNIPVIPGKTYRLSYSVSNSTNIHSINMTRFEHQEKTNSNNHQQLFKEIGKDNSNLVFTIPQGINYISFTFGNAIYTNDGTLGWIKIDNIQLEEGSLATSYEPHKSNILTVNEPVELRGIGDVKDELNLLTGELTQRIGEAVYTEKESWYHYLGNDFDNSALFSCTSLKIGNPSDSSMKTNFISDRFTPSMQIYVNDIIGSYIQNGSLFIRVKKEWLTTPDVYGLQRYLQQNPITVQYPLTTESVKTVVLSDNVVYSYDEVTHYDGSSEDGSLIPTVAVKVPTDVNAVISSQRATIQAQTEQINTLEKENTLLTEQNEKQDVDIALNQDAINFMLFEVMGLSNDDANKLNPMAIYFANQILKGKLTYTQVIGKYPQFKDDIDSCLLAEGRSDLIVKID